MRRNKLPPNKFILIIRLKFYLLQKFFYSYFFHFILLANFYILIHNYFSNVLLLALLQLSEPFHLIHSIRLSA